MRYFLFILLLGSSLAPVSVHAQGALEPTAPPAPVMKTLDQVEPRTPIDSTVPISTPGSYYLTNDITGRLTIAADDVDLDLQGFTLTGVGSVTLEIPSVSNVRVHNGTIRGSTSTTILASGSSNIVFEDLRVLDSTNGAVLITDHSGLIVIRSILVDTAGLAGLRIGTSGTESMEAVIENNVVRNVNTSTSNTRQGISVVHTGSGDLTASITGNQVFNNRTLGISVSAEGGGASRGVISGNALYGNGSTGMSINGDFVVTKNIAHANGTNYSLGSAPNAAPVSTLAAAGPWDNVEQ